MKTKKQKATDRGNELLLPFDATTKQVASIELSLATFGTLATAKAWAKNHGFDAVETSSRSEGFAIKCRAEEDFEDGSLRREVVGKSRVTALVGELTARALEADLERAKNAPAEEPSSSDPAEPTDEPTDEVEFAKAGELFVVSKAAAGEVEEEEDDPTEVRMFGIVMKPDVPDSEGDVTSAEEIENANFEFMKSFQTIGFMHKKDVSEVVKIIQDVVAPVDFEFPLPDGTTKAISKGTWFQELWSDDPEIVKRTKVEKTLNGLSIGGFAKRVPITEMRDGELVANVPEGFSAAQKRAVQEAVAKAEGDPALAQFVDLRVEEVSLVDAAANEEEFFIIKRRRDEMPGTKKNEPAADPKTTQGQPPAEPTTKANPESTPETPPTPTPAEAPAEPTIAEQVAAGVEAGVKAALEAQKAEEPSSTEPTTPEPEAAPVEKGDEILAELKKINDRIDGVEAAQKEQGVARAVAKGQSAPEGTEAPSEPEPAKKSKWAGTAVHSVFAKDAK